MSEDVAHTTFEEGFRLIAEPLNLSELEVQMHLENPIVCELAKKIMDTQKMRRQMAEFFA